LAEGTNDSIEAIVGHDGFGLEAAMGTAGAQDASVAARAKIERERERVEGPTLTAVGSAVGSRHLERAQSRVEARRSWE
jgi:hypothetical protein